MRATGNAPQSPVTAGVVQPSDVVLGPAPIDLGPNLTAITEALRDKAARQTSGVIIYDPYGRSIER